MYGHIKTLIICIILFSVAPPTTQVVAQPPAPKVNTYYDNMDQKERNFRTCSALFGLLAMIITFVAILVGELSDGGYEAEDIFDYYLLADYNCGFESVDVKYVGIQVATWEYSELCDQGVDGIAIDAACKADNAATGTLACSIIGMIFMAAGYVCFI